MWYILMDMIYHLRWCCKMTTNFWYLFVSTIVHHSIFVAICNTASNCRAGAWLLPKETNRKRWDIKPHPTRGAIHPYKKHTTPLSSWAESKDLGARHYSVMQWYKVLAEFVIYLRCDISWRMWYITFGDVAIVGTDVLGGPLQNDNKFLIFIR